MCGKRASPVPVIILYCTYRTPVRAAPMLGFYEIIGQSCAECSVLLLKPSPAFARMNFNNLTRSPFPPHPRLEKPDEPAFP
jgi:hypothetical protein